MFQQPPKDAQRFVAVIGSYFPPRTLTKSVAVSLTGTLPMRQTSKTCYSTKHPFLTQMVVVAAALVVAVICYSGGSNSRSGGNNSDNDDNNNRNKKSRNSHKNNNLDNNYY